MDINKLFRTRETTTEIREIVSKFIANLLWERRKCLVYYYSKTKVNIPLAILRDLLIFL